MMSGTAYATYGKLCRTLRAKGQTLSFYELSACAELALLLEEGDTDRARVAKLAAALGIDLEALP